MSRFDAVGLFWQDYKPERKKGERAPRPLAEIPRTGWKHPSYFPNLSSARVISLDVETYDPELNDHGPGWGRGKGEICGFSIGAPDGGRWYYPIRHRVRPEENHPYPEHCLAWLQDVLAVPRPILGAHLTYDFGWCRQEGIHIAGEPVDIQFAEALLDDRAFVSLEALSKKYLGEGKTTDLLYKWIMESYAPPKDLWRREIYRSPPSLVGPYGEGDADLPLRIAPRMYEELFRYGLMDLFRMECGLIPLLVEMRFRGVTVNVEQAQKLSEDLEKRAAEKIGELANYAGTQVNVNAADSISKAFDKFGLKYPRTAPSKSHPKGQPSFTKEFLKSVDHPLTNYIQEIRRLKKLNDTFVKGYVLDGNVNGKLYCSFHPLRGEGGGTIVGRFSGSDPNLQNIPVRDPELGKPIRAIFKADEGHVGWRKYDYSQIQFRYLVHYAQGPGAEEARQRYINDPHTDYHSMVQYMVEQATGHPWDRRPIKNLNFGLSFGMGNEKAGRSTGLKGQELIAFLDAYHKGIPYSKKTMRAIMDLATKQGYLRTILGRYERFDLWEPDVSYGEDIPVDPKTKKPYPALPYEQAIRAYGRIRRAYIHTALAKLLQGCEGDTIKTYLYRCWKEGVFDYVGVPRLLVHDEADFSDPGGKEDGFEYMQHIMETCVQARVPILAEGEFGEDWGHTERLVDKPSRIWLS